MAYRVTGIRDSEKEGWWRSHPENSLCCTSRTEVDTPIGTIIVDVASDSDYPGVYLSFQQKGDDYERTVALFEAEAPDCVTLKIWENGDEGDWTRRFVVAENEVTRDGEKN